MPVYNRFAALLGDLSVKEKRNISIAEVARKTKITPKTLQQWYSNKVTRYDAPVIEALCKYFNCSLGDLITYIPDEK